jgi:hypothetical protein
MRTTQAAGNDVLRFGREWETLQRRNVQEKNLHWFYTFSRTGRRQLGDVPLTRSRLTPGTIEAVIRWSVVRPGREGVFQTLGVRDESGGTAFPQTRIVHR